MSDYEDEMLKLFIDSERSLRLASAPVVATSERINSRSEYCVFV